MPRKQASFNASADGNDKLFICQSDKTLKDFLSRKVDVLMVTNTYGDTQTSLLLNTVHELRNDLCGGVADSTINNINTVGDNVGKARQVRYPSVIMDLPNLGIPINWCGQLDGFVAPSKATGLHFLTLREG